MTFHFSLVVPGNQASVDLGRWFDGVESRGIRRANSLGFSAKSRGGQERFVRAFYVAGTNIAIQRTCDSNCSPLALPRCACKNLHFFDLRRSREQFVGPSPQGLRNLASQVGIAARVICKGVEDAELPRSDLDRIPFQGRFFIQREWLS